MDVWQWIGLGAVAAGLPLAAAWWWQARRQSAELGRLRTTADAATARARQAVEAANAAAERADGLEATMDALPYPIWRRDAGRALVWTNRRYQEMVEASAADIVRDRRELASALDPDQPLRLVARLTAPGDSASETRRFVVAGDRRSYRIQETALASGSAGVGHDITAEEDARGQLKRHVEAHAEVLQNLATAIAVFAPDKRLTLFNRAYARLWRLDDAWLETHPRFGEILETLRENRRLPEQVDWQGYKRAQLDQFTTVLAPREDMMHLPDGTTLRVVVTPHPFGGLLFTFEDVSERLNLERDRNTLLAVQRATLDNLHEGVVVFGSDGRVGLFNAAYAKLWRLDDPFLATAPHISATIEAARPLLENGEDWAARRQELTAAFLDRTPRMGRMELADSSNVRYAATPLPDGAMLFTYLDVTDAERIERALRERNEALQAADQLKSEFIANVSYELRNPLNALIGFAELLGSQLYGELNTRQREYCELIVDSAHQLLMLVNDMLDLAVIESGHMSLEPALVDLPATIAAITTLTRERARRQSLKIIADCPADIGAMIGDERRLKQILFNLISNAIKFTPPGGEIRVSAARVGDDIHLAVADNGLGIPEGQRSLVFEKFRKGSGTPQRQPGVGVGLTLVRSFVELHGGRVTLESREGGGTVVTCCLPARTAPGTPATQE